MIEQHLKFILIEIEKLNANAIQELKDDKPSLFGEGYAHGVLDSCDYIKKLIKKLIDERERFL